MKRFVILSIQKMVRAARIIEDAFCRAHNRVVFRLKGVVLDTDIRLIRGCVRVIGSGTIFVGAGTRMNSGARRNPIGGDTVLTLVCRRGGRINIGPRCGLSNCTIVADVDVTLGEGVLIGGGVRIYDTDFHSIDPGDRSREEPGTYNGRSKPVHIDRNAFIGAHSIILKGVSIGENSVIGAGSVVARDVPPNEIWAGNPARLVRPL